MCTHNVYEPLPPDLAIEFLKDLLDGEDFNHRRAIIQAIEAIKQTSGGPTQ